MRRPRTRGPGWKSLPGARGSRRCVPGFPPLLPVVCIPALLVVTRRLLHGMWVSGRWCATVLRGCARAHAQEEEAEQREQHKRARRAAPLEEDEEDIEEPPATGAAERSSRARQEAGAAVQRLDDEEDEEDVDEPATAADQAFIDDTGVEEEEAPDLGRYIRPVPHKGACRSCLPWHASRGGHAGRWEGSMSCGSASVTACRAALPATADAQRRCCCADS